MNNLKQSAFKFLSKGWYFLATLMILTVLLMTPVFVLADDGVIFRKNVSKTPELETEFAAIRVLPVYVPVQSSNGDLLDYIEIIDTDATVVETREYAQPLVVHYTDGHVEAIEEVGYGGFPGHGERDAYGAVSLDGGATWKRSNLSKSADLSSFTYRVPGQGWVEYPGDVGRTYISSDGNQVLVVWVSRYARGGNPNYAMSDDERLAVANYLYDQGAIDDVAACTDGELITTPCPYLEDHFSVAGSQGSSDMTDEGYPLVGILPYAAVWVSRGVILPPEATGLETSSFVWFKTERLSSAVRDANRPEVACVKGAGCAVTWQEDPEGIRPGGGEGPGEGWAGAVAHHETDIWYSFIDWGDFSLVADENYGTFYSETGDLAEWVAANPEGSPQAAIPMAIPVRLTDNTMCKLGDEESKPYCFVDFDSSGTADFCASTVSVAIETPEGPTQDIDMCVAEDGRLMRGNFGSTRARIGLHGYSTEGLFDQTDPDLNPIDSAWFYAMYEENKGMGDVCDDGECPDELITDADKRDMGKNVWYHTFDMTQPELVSQGMMMNQPAIYPDDWTDPTGLLEADTLFDYNFWTFTEDPIYNWLAGITDTTLYQTEISRRPSVISQDWYDAGVGGAVAFHTWKQGIIRRGGPADIMARRFVMPTVDVGEEVCEDVYTLCTTADVCEITEVCTTESVWIDYELNPLYRPNVMLCIINPTHSRCLQYIDLDGNLTNEPGTNIEVVTCENVETCEDVTTCETVDWCDVNEGGCTVEQVCTGGGTIDYTANPYDYANMVCENPDGTSGWVFTDGTNPRYVKGFCAAPAINISGTTILTGETCADATTCLDAFPFNDYFDDMLGGTQLSKILTWQQYGPGFGEEPPEESNLDDTTWENPYEMAKGHRGFMAGDMVMVMYGWTNNWKALTDAQDIVNLYNRRSFDGGKTWSTLPTSFTHTNGITYSGDGTTTCEWMGVTGGETEYPVCTPYTAGQFEQARNVSQLLGIKVTVLDPRYSPTTRSITEASVTTDSLPVGFAAPLYPDDTRDPSRYFMIYETGHSSAYDAGEAPPLDLFYSRAVDWGDDFLVWQDTADTSACLPSAENTELSGFCNEYEALEGSQFQESGEASVTCSPSGMFFYATWNQWDFDNDGIEIGADAWFRRVLFLDDYIPPLD